jgi:23S rRNA G2069 N7-methylase RlmK/C1962 C5-methylase RlmI
VKSRRYQLRKEAVGLALHHPWIFRDHMSSAASALRDGELLRLVDGNNAVIGYGLYEASGAIAIRILRRGAAPPDAAWLRDRLTAAVARRRELAIHSDAIRLIHGESDGLPAVVVDRFGDTLVVSSYSTGADVLARYAAHALRPGPIVGPARHVVLRPAHLRHSPAEPARTLRGAPPAIVQITERDDAAGSTPSALVGRDNPASPTGSASHASPTGSASHASPTGSASHASPTGSASHASPTDTASPTGRGNPTSPTSPAGRDSSVDTAAAAPLVLSVDLAAGHKTGTYLDLRGLRREVAAAPLRGARVLNLFAYSGMLGRAAERAGATAIVQVDGSARALAFAAAHHVDDPAKHTLITADVFDWLPALSGEPFDLVIVDPPAMTSKATQVPQVLAAYRKLYRAAARQVAPGGRLIAACCTSRIERAVFHRTVGEALGSEFRLDREIPPEPDHPVGFAQGDYLKIAWWARTPSHPSQVVRAWPVSAR